MKRKAWLISLGVVAAVAFFVVVGIREQSNSRRALEDARRQARQMGIPLSEAEFVQFMAPPPDAENAWKDLRQAIVWLRPGVFGGVESKSPLDVRRESVEELLLGLRGSRRGRMDVSLAAKYRDILRQLSPVFDRARVAAGKEGLYIEKTWRNGLATGMPEPGEILRLCRLMLLDGLARRQEGNGAGFRERVETVEKIAKLLGRQGLPICANVANAIHSDVIEAVQLHICQMSSPDSDLEWAKGMIDAVGSKLSLRQTLLSYLYLSVGPLDILSSRERMVEAGIDDRWALRNVPKPEQREITETQILRYGLAILNRWPSDETDSLAVREALKSDDIAIDRALREFSPALRIRFPNLSRPLSSFGLTLESYESMLARKRAAAAMLAALEVKKKTGSFPVRLPTVGKDAIDPFSGQALHYARRDDGFIIYSVGVNRNDDGGLDVLSDGRPLDLVVRYPGAGFSL